MTSCAASSGPRRLVALLGAAVVAAGALGASAGAAAPNGVHGRVIALDEKGKPTGAAAGAKIEFKDAAGKAVAQTTADSGGYYRVQLPPGTYFYKVMAPGFKTEDQGRGITLSLSEGLAVYNFSLSKGPDDPQRKAPEQKPAAIGRLCGRVLEKTAGGSLVGISHATVSLRPEHGGRRLIRVISRQGGSDRQGAGAYEVVLETGAWRASASADGFETLVDPEPIRVVEGRTATRDFILTRVKPSKPDRQGIKGLVALVDPKSPQGAAAAAGGAPAQVEVQIVAVPRAGRPGHRLHPRSSGPYALDLGLGVYQVLAKADGYRPARSGPAYVFPGKYTVVNLTLVRAGRPEPPPQALALEAAVVERLPHGTRPLAGADVLVRAKDQSLAAAPRGTTGAQGKVLLQVGQAGPYVALAQKPGYAPGGVRVEISATGPNLAEIVLQKQSPTLPATPTPTPIQTPRPAPTPMPITTTPATPTPTPIPRPIPRPIPVPRPTPRPTPGDAPLSPVGVRGYVVQADKTSPTGFRAVPGSDVAWISPQTRQAAARARADDAGRFAVTLPEGRYVAAVTPPAGYIGARKEVDVRPGIGLQHFVVVASGATSNPGTGGTPGQGAGDAHTPEQTKRLTLHLRIVERPSQGHSSSRTMAVSAKPVAGARITVAQHGRGIAAGQSDQGGVYRTQLAPGSYSIEVARPGYLPAHAAVSLAHGDATREIVLTRAGGSHIRGDEKPGGSSAAQKAQGSGAGKKPQGTGTGQKLQRPVNGFPQQAAGGKSKGPVLKPKPKSGAGLF